ncbi:MAG: T9SS type A sorting domain-containing protein [Bacteroidota bacterium]
MSNMKKLSLLNAAYITCHRIDEAIIITHTMVRRTYRIVFHLLSALALVTTIAHTQLRYDEVILPRLLQSMTVQMGAMSNRGLYGYGIADTTWYPSAYSKQGIRRPFYLHLDSLGSAIHTQYLPDTGYVYSDWNSTWGEISSDIYSMRAVGLKDSTFLLYRKQGYSFVDIIPGGYGEPDIHAFAVSNVNNNLREIFKITSSTNPDMVVDHNGKTHIVFEHVTSLVPYGIFENTDDYYYRSCELARNLDFPDGSYDYQVIDQSGYFPQIQIDGKDSLHLLYFSAASSVSDSFSMKYMKGYGNQFQSPHVLRRVVEAHQNSWNGEPPTISFSVCRDGRQAHVGWTERNPSNMVKGIYSMLITDDSIHVDSLNLNGFGSEGIFLSNPLTGNNFVIWNQSGMMHYSSDLHGTIFSAIKTFSIGSSYVEPNFFLDPLADMQPSFLCGVSGSGILYLRNLEGKTDSFFYPIPLFRDLVSSVIIDSQQNIYTAYTDTSAAVHTVRISKISTGISLTHLSKPMIYSLSQNYPNPFNPSTKINYTLAHRAQVKIIIYDILGDKITTLANGIQEAGAQSVTWDAKNVASGVYFYRLEALSIDSPSSSFVQVKKMVIIR